MNTMHQWPNKFQFPRTKKFDNLVINYWELGIWSLEFGTAGRSAAWLARLPWEQEVGRSNRLAPTMFFLVFQTGHWAIPLCFCSLLTNFLLTLFSSPPPHYDIFKSRSTTIFNLIIHKALLVATFPLSIVL